MGDPDDQVGTVETAMAVGLDVGTVVTETSVTLAVHTAMAVGLDVSTVLAESSVTVAVHTAMAGGLHVSTVVAETSVAMTIHKEDFLMIFPVTIIPQMRTVAVSMAAKMGSSHIYQVSQSPIMYLQLQIKRRKKTVVSLERAGRLSIHSNKK